MQSANWDSAAESFTQTLQALLLEASGPSRAQRQAFAAQYLAAVMLLKAAGAGTSAKEARLYRCDTLFHRHMTSAAGGSCARASVASSSVKCVVGCAFVSVCMQLCEAPVPARDTATHSTCPSPS